MAVTLEHIKIAIELIIFLTAFLYMLKSSRESIKNLETSNQTMINSLKENSQNGFNMLLIMSGVQYAITLVNLQQ